MPETNRSDGSDNFSAHENAPRREFETNRSDGSVNMKRRDGSAFGIMKVMELMAVMKVMKL